MAKVFLKTFGCQMNEYDSSRMLDLLYQAEGLTPTDSPNNAKLLMLNTCSIREKAQEKVFSELGRWRELKQQDPEIIIGVTGCVASQEGAAIQKRAPYVDFVLGPQTIHRLPEILKQLQIKREPIVDISFPAIEKFDKLPSPTSNGPSALISIMEGCNKSCSYCIVPITRGKEVNRPIVDILAEVNILGAQGVKEITLLGQNVNAYKDKTETNKIADLAELLAKIAQVDAIERIRFMTSHPIQFTDRLVAAYRDLPKLANHLHLPVQSGSDRILKLMKRGYSAEIFSAKVAALRAVRPDIAVSTDIIVGFPGETEQDFAATMELVQNNNLDHSYSFIYSRRPGTPAAEYPDDVTMTTKKARLQVLQELIQQQAIKISNNMIGTVQKVLITGPASKKPNLYVGKTENNRNVYISSATMLIGQIIPIYINRAVINNLYGEIYALDGLDSNS